MAEGSVGWVFPAFGHSVNEDGDGDRNYGHPSHRGFQEQIGAEPVLFPSINPGPVSGTFLEPFLAARELDILEYDAFVLENAEALYATPYIRRQYPDTKIILLAAHRVFGLESYNFSGDTLPKSAIRKLERYGDAKIIRRLIREYVDGILTVSKFVSEYVSDFAGEIPRRVVYPYVQPELAEQLSACDRSVDGYHAITVCEARDHKGVDMLVDSWPAVRDRHPDATLGIIGKGHPVEYERTAGVSIHGFVDDLAEEYERADLYIHPARADAFGVTVIESMMAGTPPLVTRTTGSREVVAQIGSELVVDPTEEGLVKGIRWYFDQPNMDRYELADVSVRLSQRFTRDTQLEHFSKAYEDIIRSIQ